MKTTFGIVSDFGGGDFRVIPYVSEDTAWRAFIGWELVPGERIALVELTTHTADVPGVEWDVGRELASREIKTKNLT